MTDQSVAVISAGASGIGLVCARALSAEGFRVLTLDIDADAVEAFQVEFGSGTGVCCDVSDPAQVEMAWQHLVGSSGRVDLLLNNAGIAGPQQLVEDMAVDAWRQTIDTDLNSVLD